MYYISHVAISLFDIHNNAFSLPSPSSGIPPKLQKAKSPTSSQQSPLIPLSSVLTSTFDPWPPTTPSPVSVSVCLFCGSYSYLSGFSCSCCCWLCCWLESGAVLEDLMERPSDSGQLCMHVCMYLCTYVRMYVCMCMYMYSPSRQLSRT